MKKLTNIKKKLLINSSNLYYNIPLYKRYYVSRFIVGTIRSKPPTDAIIVILDNTTYKYKHISNLL